jgi:uncharacterized protein with NRDE domain
MVAAALTGPHDARHSSTPAPRVAPLGAAVCLLVLAWKAVAAERLVLVANRDEFHGRPTAALDWWPDGALLGGRDLQAGGTWLALDRRGRFAAITNFRGAPAPPDAPSRGALIPRFLRGALPPLAFLESLQSELSRYAGFSLLVGDEHELAYLCSRDASAPRRLPAGVYGLSNATLDAPWPKLVTSRAKLAERLAAPLATIDLLDLLGERGYAADRDLPDTGIGLAEERRLSAPFVLGRQYGTRSTTAVLLGLAGGGEVAERTYDSAGAAQGTRVVSLP